MSSERNEHNPAAQDGLHAPRQAVVDAVNAVLAVKSLGDLEDRRMRRQFDPTWAELQTGVVAYTLALRDHGFPIEATISAVKDAILEAAEDIPPHNGIRAAAVGWCVATYFRGSSAH